MPIFRPLPPSRDIPTCLSRAPGPDFTVYPRFWLRPSSASLRSPREPAQVGWAVLAALSSDSGSDTDSQTRRAVTRWFISNWLGLLLGGAAPSSPNPPIWVLRRPGRTSDHPGKAMIRTAASQSGGLVFLLRCQCAPECCRPRWALAVFTPSQVAPGTLERRYTPTILPGIRDGLFGRSPLLADIRWLIACAPVQ